MPTNEELEGMLLAMRTEMTGLRTRIAELEDFAQTHIGLDWGTAGTTANMPHPNLSVDTVESGGGATRQDLHGMQVASDGADQYGMYIVDALVPNPSAASAYARFGGQVTSATSASGKVASFVSGGGLAAVTTLATATAASIELAATIGNGAVLTISDDGTITFVKLEGQLRLPSDLTPAQITANQDNYAPTGIADTTVLRLSTDASRDITGIAGGADGRVLKLVNVGSFNIVLKDDVTSTEANRFQLKADLTIAPDGGAILWYDSTSSRWRCAGTY